MMKRFGSIVAVTLFLAATAASARAQAAATPTAVGLINFQKAVTQNDDGMKAQNLYSQEGDKLKDGLLKAQAKVIELQDKFAKAPATTSDSDKAAMTREIEKAKKLYEADQQDAQNAMDDKQEELFRPIADRVHKVVEAYAKELNLALVLNGSEDMIYYNEVVDITTEIIRRVNADIVKNPTKK